MDAQRPIQARISAVPTTTDRPIFTRPATIAISGPDH